MSGVAKDLVTLILAINIAFAVYMAVQFFMPKAHGNGLHAIYVVIVLATTRLLGRSTHRLWSENTKQGALWFFAAGAVSFSGNLVTQLIA